ncbi:MAG: hypothetical protein ACE147_14410 [Candidatus Methylomirabilales bacterium]
MQASAPSLLVTVDVEADMPRWQIEDPLTFRNMQALPAFHRACTDAGLRPTYLVEHALLEDARSTAVLKELQAGGQCEIGAHLHPWSCPPFAPGERARIEYPSNLPAPHLRAKLERLTARLGDTLGRPPVSYRAGKFGLSAATPPMLAALGYAADTSVTPLVDWRPQGGPDFTEEAPHPRVLLDGPRPLLEVPVGITLTRRLPAPLRRAYLRAPRALHLRGLLGPRGVNLVELCWLYPALFSAEQMIAACDRLVAEGVPVLNVFLHSSELCPGQSPYTRSADDVRAYLERFLRLVAHARRRHAARGETLAEFTHRYPKETGRERPGHLVAGYR